MIIKNKQLLSNRFFIKRPGLSIEPKIELTNNTINYETDTKINDIISEIKQLYTPALDNTPKKEFKNFDDIVTLNEIKEYLTLNKKHSEIVIFNYNENINIELIKNFLVVDCLSGNTQLSSVDLNNDDVLPVEKLDDSKITLGFINYNFYNNNNDFLLNNAALPSFFKYNDSEKYDIIIINDIKNGIEKIPNEFKNYDFAELNKCKYRNSSFYIDLSHTIKIDTLIKLCKTKYLILCDCDIIFKKSLDEYIKLFEEYDIFGTIEQNRIVPFLLFLNIEKLKEEKFNFADATVALNHTYINTGANLLNNINKFRFKEIDIYDAIIHYGAVSQRSRLNKYDSNCVFHLEYIHKDVQDMSIDDFLKLV